MVFFQVADLLCQNDDERELDDLRRLDADAEKAQPVLPVLSLTPKGISSSRKTTLNAHRICHLSASTSTSSTVMTTNAKTPRMSDALCTMTYLAEWYDAVASR